MTAPTDTPARPLWPYLLLNALVAVWIAFSGIHRGHNSDSIVFSLISVYDWTPFYWQQDRVGMLVPLIASVCADPVLNLVIQTGLTTFAALCVPLFLAELVYPHPAGRVAATLANAAMLLLAPVRIQDNLLYECCYPLALSLGCAGLLVLGRGASWPKAWRIAGALGLLVLACWVYVGVPLWLGPLALLRGWIQPGEPRPAGRRALIRPALHPRTILGCGLIVIAFGIGFELMKTASWSSPLIDKTPREGLPPAEWPASWWRFAENLAQLPGMGDWSLALFGAAGVGIAATILLRRRVDYPILAALPVLLLPAAAEFLFLGTREWTAANGHHPRYLIGTLESVQTVLALAAVLPLAGFTAGRGRCVVVALAAIALFAAATARYGFPSPDRPRRELNALAGQWTPDLIAANVDAVGGDYWTVWLVVYHVNLVRRENGDDRLFCAIALRGRVLLHRWDSTQQRALRVAVRKDSKERAEFFTAVTACQMSAPVKIGEYGPFEIYLTHPADAG